MIRQKLTIFIVLFLACASSYSQKSYLVWNPSPEPDVAGYKVYFGKASGRFPFVINVGQDTSFLVINEMDTLATFFAVTAYDVAGHESAFSDIVTLSSPEEGIHFSLEANYPNPFNPETNIPIVLHQREYVSLIIYNLLGQRVKVITQGQLDPDRYVFRWDSTNENGVTVANGLYFCRLVVGQFCQTRKLTLQR